jgi:tRNA (mo5U34)-methyltransferase
MNAEEAPSLEAAIAARGFWYHTMELAPGVVTPGWFDLRPIVDRMPWPDVRGLRCLDIGPYDGFLAFEMERRGASEVVAADIADPAGWDWPLAMRERGPRELAARAGDHPGGGFEIAKSALGSSVERVEVSVYELSEQTVGSFDVVTCGSLLLHLRDPIRALEAIRGVCRGALLSAEAVSAGLTLVAPRRPVARFRGGERLQWFVANAAAHRAMVRSAGFEIDRMTRPYAIPLGPGHPARGLTPDTLHRNATAMLLTGRRGIPHAALLAGPRA